MKKQIESVVFNYKAASLVDFHAHILPTIDDGSCSVEESLEMLRLLRCQGVRTVVATPHFYPRMECPDDFVYKRESSADRLREAVKGCENEMPRVCLGAEVPYFTGISGSRSLCEFCFAGTNTILIEMPCEKWSEAVINEIIRIKRVVGLDVVIAHAERYAKYQSETVLNRLSAEKIAFQLNCEAFIRFIYKKTACRFLKSEGAILLGTDCHDLSLRKPNMDKAIEAIIKKLDENSLEERLRMGEAYLANARYIW